LIIYMIPQAFYKGSHRLPTVAYGVFFIIGKFRQASFAHIKNRVVTETVVSVRLKADNTLANAACNYLAALRETRNKSRFIARRTALGAIPARFSRISRFFTPYGVSSPKKREELNPGGATKRVDAQPLSSAKAEARKRRKPSLP
jgi:hypothetical protein